MNTWNLRIVLLPVVLMLGLAQGALAQCQGGYADDFQGCTLARDEIFEWSDSTREYSCRQKLEARLFYGFLPYFQQRNNAIRYAMENSADRTNQALSVLNTLQTAISVASIAKGAYTADIPGLTLDSMQFLEENTGAVGDVLHDFLGIDSQIASDLVQLALEESSAILAFSATSNPLLLPAGLGVKLAEIYHSLFGAYELTALTAELDSQLIAWWYLEDFYRLGGTFDGSGVDAHGLVAVHHGLPVTSDVHTVIAEIAEEKSYKAHKLYNWWFGDMPYDLDVAVAFAEDLKARVNQQLLKEVAARSYSVDILPGELYFGAKVDTTWPLDVEIHNLDSEYLTLCWTTRHGTVSGDFEGGFSYHAPDRLIDESDPFDSTEELRLQVNNGIGQREDVLTFSLRNQQIFLVLTVVPRPDAEMVNDYEIEYRLDGETGWRSYLDFDTFLLAGTHTVEFRPVAGYVTPPSQTLTAPNRGSDRYAWVYVDYEPLPAGPLMGSIQVHLNRTEGRWRIRGEATWLQSGQVAADLDLGLYDVEFRDVAGWVRPQILQAHVSQESTLVLQGDYEAVPASKGSLQLDLQGSSDFLYEPGLGFWRVQGDQTWRALDHLYEQLPTGTTTVEFRQFHGWQTPSDQSVSIGSGVNPVSAQYLADSAREFFVGGRVRENLVGIEGVTVSGYPDGPVTTDRFGVFRKKVPDGWQGTLTASKSGITFEPTEIAVQVNGTWTMNNNFRVADTQPEPDRTAPVVKILAPMSFQTLRSGETFVVRWSAEDDSGLLKDVTLQYRNVVTNQNWVTIEEGLQDVSEYAWKVPDHMAAQTTLLIAAEDFSGNVMRKVGAPFTVSGGGICRSPGQAPRLIPWVSIPFADYTVDWVDVPYTDHYVLQEDTHPSFSNPVEYTASDSFQYLTDHARDTYYYRVKAVGTCGSSPWSETEDYLVLANQGPDSPHSPVPANGAGGVSRGLQSVSWEAGDPDGDSLEYDVYFGKSEPLSRICRKTSSRSCATEGPLDPGASYFWKVVAIDEHGSRTTGPIWSLATEAIFADLGITQLLVDDPSPEIEGILTITAHVGNQGNEPADDTWIYFYVESLDRATSYQIKREYVPPLAIDASTVVETQATLPHGFLGPYLLVARVNKNNSIPEQNRVNNEEQLDLSIVDSQDPMVSVFWPRATTRTYKTGFEMEIRWDERDNEGIASRDIHYSQDSGAWQQILLNSTIAYGGYDWLIPDQLEGSNVRIKVTVRDHSGNWAEGVSDSVSVVSGVAPVVTVLAPTGGEQLLSETPYTLRWEATSPLGIQDIDLGLYRDGIKVKTIAYNVPNTGSYTWSPSSSLINRDYVFGVEAEGTNGVETRGFSPAPFRIVDSFQVPLPWHTPLEVFTIPDPPPIPPNAYNYAGLPPAWSQWTTAPRVAVDANGVVHCVVRYGERILMRNPGANWTYDIGNEGVLYRSWFSGSFGPQEKKILLSYDESTNYAESVFFGRDGGWLADSSGELHLAYIVKSVIPTFDGSTPQTINTEVFYTSRLSSTWSSPVNVSQTANVSSDSVSMAMTSDQTVHLAWREKISGHSQVYHRSHRPSTGWSAGNVALDNSFLPAIAVEGSDDVIVVAQSFEPIPELVLTRHDGVSWSPRQTVWPGSSGGHSPQIAVSPTGDAYAFVANGAYINVTRVTPGTWQDWSFQFPDAESWPEVAMFFDSTGSPHLGYTNTQIASFREVVVERRILEDGSFGPMNFVDTTAGSAEDIEMAFTPSGTAYAIWKDVVQAGKYEPILLNHATFTDDLEKPSVTVSEPAGGQALAGGSAIDVRWNATDNVGVTSVNLKFSTDGALTYQTIALAQPDTGVHSWTLPEEDLPSVLVLVEAHDANGNVGTGLSQSFAIVPQIGDVTLLAPNGSEHLTNGETATISWDGGTGATFSLGLSLDDGELWAEITSGLTGVSSYAWTVPDANSGRARVKVMADFGDGEVRTDVSDGAFSIQEQTGPFEPHSPFPPVNAGYVASGVSLSWEGGHPDAAASLTFDVAFGDNVNSLAPLCTTPASPCAAPAGLATNTQYYWQVTARDGTVAIDSPVWTFHTGDPSGLLPPTALAAAERSDGSVALLWSDANTEDVVHVIEKQWPGTTTFQQIAQQDGSLRSFEDPDVAGSQEYVYRVRAVRLDKAVAGTSGTSNEEHILTSNQAPDPPSSPSPPTGSGIFTLQPTFSWLGGDPDAEDTVTYRMSLWAPESPRGDHPGLVTPSWVQGSALLANTLYSWQVMADDDRGGQTVGPIWSVETPAVVPEAPVLVSVFQDDDKVVLTWEADPAPGEGLFVERRLTSTLPFELVESWTPRELTVGRKLSAIDVEASPLLAGISSDFVTYRVGVYNEEGYYSYSSPLDIVVIPTFPEADLVITKENNLTTVVPGEAVTYTITVTNNGPAGVSGANARDTFPAQLTDVTWSCAGTGGGVCTGNGTGNVDDSVDLPAGATVTYTATTNVDPAAVGTLSNTATVTAPSGVTDPSLGNESATDSDVLQPEADLSVAMTAAPSEVEAGSAMSYDVMITNPGPSVASGLEVTLELPAGATYSGALCTAVGTTVTCNLAELTAGSASNFSVEALAPGGCGPASASVTVTSDVVERNLSDNSDLAGFSVICNPLPTVSAVSTVAESGALFGGKTIPGGPTQILLRFGVEMYDAPGDDSAVDVSNPANYLLVAAGADGSFTTVGCSAGVGAGDELVPVGPLSYDVATSIAALRLNGGIPVVRGRYRLLACSAGLENVLAMPLDGNGDGTGGDDFLLDFFVASTNLLDNPNFDLGLGGWSLSNATGIDHDPATDPTAVTSGSASFTKLSGVGAELSVSQCLEMPGLTGLLVGGRTRVSSPSAQDPLFGVFVESYDGAGCAGALLNRVAPDGLTGDSAATWRSFQGSAILPGETASVRIVFDFEADDALGFEAWLDEVYLFGSIFSDGLESGDTSRWSTSVP